MLPADACVRLRSQPGRAWDAQLDALAETCAALSLQGHRAMTMRDARWKLVVSTPLLPSVRLYRLDDRYPATAIFDFFAAEEREVQSGHRIERVDAAVFAQLLHDRRVRVQSPTEAAELARFFALLRGAPYLPEDIELTTSAVDRGWNVTVVYSRTVPWSPPDPSGRGLSIAGAKIVKVTSQLRVDMEAPGGFARLLDLGQHEEDVRTMP